jgi:hypothetical protein
MKRLLGSRGALAAIGGLLTRLVAVVDTPQPARATR